MPGLYVGLWELTEAVPDINERISQIHLQQCKRPGATGPEQARCFLVSEPHLPHL